MLLLLLLLLPPSSSPPLPFLLTTACPPCPHRRRTGGGRRRAVREGQGPVHGSEDFLAIEPPEREHEEEQRQHRPRQRVDDGGLWLGLWVFSVGVLGGCCGGFRWVDGWLWGF